MLERKKFILYENPEQKKRKKKVSSVDITSSEAWIKEGAKALNQAKLSTAIKQLAYIGYTEVVLNEKMNHILDFIFNNSRKNERIGIYDLDHELEQK